MKFRKKPIIVDAMEYTGKKEHKQAMLSFCQGKAQIAEQGDYMVIITLEGIMEVSIGDWIIKGIKGEFYPCKPDIFSLTYDFLDEN